jgi:hypothetical protein
MLHLFFPNKIAGVAKERFAEAGVLGLLRPDDDQPGCCDLVGPGPGGQNGQVWSWGAAKYTPDSQTWHPARGADYWYGFDRDQPPHVALARRRQYDGRGVVAGVWQLPSVDHVPHKIDLDAQGDLVRLPDTAYADFADEAGQLLNVFADFGRNQLDPGEFNWQRQATFVVSALALNYRINLEIATRLGLLTDSDLWTHVLRIGAAETVRAIFADLDKKKAAAAPSGSPPSAG